MRVAIVEPDGSGGLAHYAYQLAAALQEQGADVTLITSQHHELAHLDPPFHVERMMRLWPQVRPGPHRGLPRILRRTLRAVRYTREWARVTRYLLGSRPDIIQFSAIRFSYLGVFLRRLRRRGLVLTQICHEYELREGRAAWVSRLETRLARSVYRCFSAIFFHGSGHRDRFLELFGEQDASIRLIPHGNETLLAEGGDTGDLRHHYGLPEDRPVALFFGDLRPSKGIPDLLEAFADARTEVDATLIVAGRPTEGVDPLELHRRVERLGLTGSVLLEPGYVPIERVGPLIRTADVVVLPYRSGTASGVLQTAYTFGRPVVVTDVGSVAEPVDNGITGLVVPAGSREAMARALVKLLDDRAAARKMGRAAREIAAERYGWRPIAATLLEEYRRLP